MSIDSNSYPPANDAIAGSVPYSPTSPGYPTPPPSYPAQQPQWVPPSSPVSYFQPPATAPKPWVSKEIVEALEGAEGTDIHVMIWTINDDTDSYKGTVSSIGEETVSLLSLDLNEDGPGAVTSFIRLDLIVSVEYVVAR